MKTIAIANQKGGCGKTTTTVNLAACLAQQGKQVLVIDMDPQGHASLGLGFPCDNDAGLFEVLMTENEMVEVISTTQHGVDLIPATISLAAVEQLLADLKRKDHQLLLYMNELPDIYDIVLLDCPPQLGLLSINALIAADEIIIPVDMSSYSLDGLDRLIDTLSLLKERYDMELPFTILPTMVDYRTRFTNIILDELRERFSDNVIAKAVHFSVRVREAAYQGKPLISYKMRSPVIDDYMDLANSIVQEQQPLPDDVEDDLEAIKVISSDTIDELISRAFKEMDMKDGNDERMEVRLDFGDLDCETLEIAGDFNNWVPDLNVETLRINGAFKKILRVAPGEYQYRLVIDGRWTQDPKNPNQILNSYGEINSLLKVNAEPALDPA
jgi:chromosome partitioning protein